MLFQIEDYYIGESPNPVVVKFEFTPEERTIIFAAPEDCQEGCPAEVNIYEVMFAGTDIVDELDKYEYYAMEEACFAKVEEHFEAIQCGKDDAAEAREDERRGR